MKKLYFSLFGITAISFMSAQFSITSVNIPVVGDSSTYYNLDTTTISAGSSGTAQTWDFSTIPVKMPLGVTKYASPSSTAYSADFPSSSFVSNDSGKYMGFYKFAGNVYQNDGVDLTVQGINIEMIFSNTPGVLFTSLPVSYGYSNPYDSIDGIVKTSLGNGTVSGHVITVADGSGTLILQGGTFTNVLRLKVITHLNASVSTFLGTATATLDETRYMWFNSSSKFPLFQTGSTGQHVIVPPSTNSSATTRFASMNSIGYVGMEENKNSVSFNLFPNPANNEISLKISTSKTGSYSYEVMNQLGQVVRAEVKSISNSGTMTKKIDLAGLPAGIYFVRLYNAEFSKVQKFIIE